MFNDNIVKGKWNELKGEIRKIWGKITDDELEQAKGDMTHVSGLIQTRYGESQESIRQKLNSFVSRFPDKKEDEQQPTQTY